MTIKMDLASIRACGTDSRREREENILEVTLQCRESLNRQKATSGTLCAPRDGATAENQENI
eukprot:TRINITY_DN6255_c0_g1_i1.p3 TRINITY_DN6255_c0_g1~~TRINITY_DN6255_c0_g1_i1.p3  ORF type:complete len:62 (-),score=5.62 TRINITY_DN6255_c0_g1_i1:50-235(-)